MPYACIRKTASEATSPCRSPRTRCSTAARAAPPCHGMPHAALIRPREIHPRNPQLRQAPERETAGQAPAPRHEVRAGPGVVVAGVQDHRVSIGYRSDEAAGHGVCPMQPPGPCPTQHRRIAAGSRETRPLTILGFRLSVAPSCPRSRPCEQRLSSSLAVDRSARWSLPIRSHAGLATADRRRVGATPSVCAPRSTCRLRHRAVEAAWGGRA